MSPELRAMNRASAINDIASQRLVDEFTKNPKNKLNLNFSELHQTGKLFNQDMQKEKPVILAKINEKRKELVKALQEGKTQLTKNLLAEITQLLTVAFPQQKQTI